MSSSALGSAVCVSALFSLHTELLFPNPHCKEKATISSSRFTFQFKRVAELNKNHSDYKFPRETSNDGSFSSDTKEFP